MTAEVMTAVDFGTASLEEIEAFIAPRLRSFVEVGQALLTIRERRLHLESGYDRFEDYCAAEWEMDRSYGQRLCDAAQVQAIISADAPGGTGVENERQARELAPLLAQPEELRSVWREAFEGSDGKPTAALIRTIRRQRDRERTPDPLPPEDGPGDGPPSFPAEAHRIYTLISQVAAEVEALGGAQVMAEQSRGLAPETAQLWRQSFTRVSGICRDLSEALG